MTSPKTILYARFSPRPNAAECESCESQLTDLRTYAGAHDLDIVGEYSDKAVSGADDWEDILPFCEHLPQVLRDRLVAYSKVGRAGA